MQELTEFQILKDGFQCAPLKYSNGKNQLNIVSEILEQFDRYDTCLLKGSVGSGKSLIAILIAAKLGGGIGVVPTKTLQTQYSEDYGPKGKIQIAGIKIGMIKGRGNFQCKKYKSRKCSDKLLPCARQLRKKETRWDATANCPHFVYLSAKDYSADKRFEKSVFYNAISPRFGGINLPKDPCAYYEQFLSYADDHITILNLAMWQFERMIGRMPKKPLVFLDEIDFVLDSLTLRTTFTKFRFERLEAEGGEEPTDSAKEDFIRLDEAYHDLAAEAGLKEDITAGKIGVFLETLMEYLKTIDTEYSLQYLSKLNMLLRFDSVCANIDYPLIEFFIPEPGIVWAEIRESIPVKILGMSASMQSKTVLKNIFGIKDYGYVEGETKVQGTVLLDNCYPTLAINYKSWQDVNIREYYHRTLSQIVDYAPKPVFISVQAKKYVPDKIDLTSINTDDAIENFKNGDLSILWSTKIRRGVDFPNAKSCIIIKYPWPDKSAVIEKVMELRLGKSAYNAYYIDRAEREFTQAIGRGLRRPDQKLYFFSPDITCHRALQGMDDVFNIEEV